MFNMLESLLRRMRLIHPEAEGGPTPGFVERALTTELPAVETPLLDQMRRGLVHPVATHIGYPDGIVERLPCESRHPTSGHRCVLAAGHDGDHQASERAGRHWT